MAIRSWIPGYSMAGKEQRFGDVEVMISGDYCLIIDGGDGLATDKLIAYLKRNKIKKVYLLLSHAHWDHYYGLREIIRDSYFEVVTFYCYDPKSLEVGLRDNRGSREVRDDINTLKNIINECKSKGIKVKYLKHNDKVALGDIKFKVFRKQPTKVEDDDTNGWAYVNDGSLCLYFYELYYWTSGDGSERIWDFIKELGIKVRFFKIPHHGNNCSRSQAEGLKNHGVNYCWYNDLEPNGIGTNDFTLFGARRCKQAGINVITVNGDINWIAQKGRMVIYKDTHKYTIPVNYQGKAECKQPTVDIIRGVFEQKYGKGNDRITRMLDMHIYPVSVQNKVNMVIRIAKKIIDRTVNYGTNEERIKNLDKKFGKGYGQLIQDEINSLLNAKSKKW